MTIESFQKFFGSKRLSIKNLKKNTTIFLAGIESLRLGVYTEDDIEQCKDRINLGRALAPNAQLVEHSNAQIRIGFGRILQV